MQRGIVDDDIERGETTGIQGIFPLSSPLVARAASRVLEVILAGADSVHDGVEDTELAGGEGADHNATRGETDGGELDEADVFCDVHETSGGGASATSAGFVDFRQKGVCGVGDDGGDDTGHNA